MDGAMMGWDGAAKLETFWTNPKSQSQTVPRPATTGCPALPIADADIPFLDLPSSPLPKRNPSTTRTSYNNSRPYAGRQRRSTPTYLHRIFATRP